MQLSLGKTLGGGTNINYMIYVRGNPLDFDTWAGLGNPGWSYREILPYYLKMEDAHIKIQDKGFHSKGGYLTVSDVPYRTVLVDTYVKAAQEAGHRYVDYNGKTQMGVSHFSYVFKEESRKMLEIKNPSVNY